MSIKAVLFDLDGTLLDRDASLVHFACDQHDRFPQLQLVDKDIYVQKFTELDQHGYVWKDKVYRQLLDEFRVQGLDWTDLLEDYLNAFQRHCRPYPHLLKMLMDLTNRGIKLALVSNGYGQFQYDNFKALGIGHLFDEVLISEWEGLRKPDPAIFIRALGKLGVQAENALFVGDHPINDIKASRNAGMRAVWKRNGVAEQEVDADAVIDDLDEIMRIVLDLER
ncbi:HAD family hydrolase [Paenibacillus sp. GCM10023248]|uniref:HAD family hydrolase n=1 Tax=Bacillales TaxID=1385 RepID=UPI00237957F0|nr:MULTISPECIES: HAD family hydrolase [Bacillales]MDD9268272.1 HAD family hydrolase [Paenibacillus sp. MAHUQ-63]MDR6879950.1 putative hydrolase of the HAD superfamily [Bacillus sp. 3255]